MITKLTSDISNYKTMIKRVRTLAWMIYAIDIDLPNKPRQGLVGHVGMMKTLFSRSILRSVFFAEQFVTNLENEVTNIEQRAATPTHSKQFALVISDALFFNFDAFVFSSKVITEKSIIGLGRKHFHANVRDAYSTYIDGFLASFNVRLRDIRNEISHINTFGTAIGSIMTYDNGTVSVRSEHNNGKDLIPLFNELFTESTMFIEVVTKYILNSECAEYGYPKKDTNFDGIHASEFVKIIHDQDELNAQ